MDAFACRQVGIDTIHDAHGNILTVIVSGGIEREAVELIHSILIKLIFLILNLPLSVVLEHLLKVKSKRVVVFMVNIVF
jgi:hypothetical protein